MTPWLPVNCTFCLVPRFFLPPPSGPPRVVFHYLLYLFCFLTLMRGFLVFLSPFFPPLLKTQCPGSFAFSLFLSCSFSGSSRVFKFSFLFFYVRLQDSSRFTVPIDPLDPFSSDLQLTTVRFLFSLPPAPPGGAFSFCPCKGAFLRLFRLRVRVVGSHSLPLKCFFDPRVPPFLPPPPCCSPQTLATPPPTHPPLCCLCSAASNCFFFNTFPLFYLSRSPFLVLPTLPSAHSP